jgi:DNA-binding transcriptional LysR family regulator
MDLRSIDLHLLAVLRSLLSTRSVSATALQLNMSQPAASRALGRLRHALDDPLFLKGAREMTPTDRALALSGPLADALAALERFFEPPQFDPALTERIIRLSTTDYGAIAVIPQVAAILAKASPGLRLEISPLTRDSFRELADGRSDFVLYPQGQVPQNCRMLDLFRDDYACVIRRGHKLAKAGTEEIPLEDYLAWPHALVTVFGGRRGLADDRLEARGKTRKLALWMPYFSSVAVTVEETDMILTVPRRAAEIFARTGALVVRESPVEIEPFTYSLVWHVRTARDPALGWFRQTVGDLFAAATGA